MPPGRSVLPCAPGIPVTSRTNLAQEWIVRGGGGKIV